MTTQSSDQINESAILSQEKAEIIYELNGKKPLNLNASSNPPPINFYGKFLTRCLEMSTLETSMSQQSPTRSKRKKELFETDLEKIKTSSQLLEVIDKELFKESDQGAAAAATANNEFNLQPISVQQTSSNSQSQKKSMLSNEQKEKLFQVLASTDKVVIHTSQNKDLMMPTERKDVVRLAQWLEDMMAKIYNLKELDFLEYFESIQLVCSACMSELIRQISFNVSERGQLTKRVWESNLLLMKQAFEQLTQEKQANERTLKDEIKSVHKMYLRKLDELLPQLENSKQQLEIKEQTNKRIVLEFRYLRKKDAKLEKYLKLAKKDLRAVEEDYNKLEKDINSQKMSFEKQEFILLQNIEMLKKEIVAANAAVVVAAATAAASSKVNPQNQNQINANYTNSTDGIHSNNQNIESKNENVIINSENHNNQNNKKRVFQQDSSHRIKVGFDAFNRNYEAYNKDVKSLTDQFEREVRDFNRRNHQTIPIDQIENMEEQIYSNKKEVERLLLLDERIVEEISGSDGMKQLIGHCGVQVGPDLLKMTDHAVDTASLIISRERTTQTFVAEIDVKEVQTPLEWMKFDSGKSMKSGGNNVLLEYDVEKEDDGVIEEERQRIEEAEQEKFDKMKRMWFITEDEETQERERLLGLPFVKDYLNNGDDVSPMGKSKASLTGSWKDEDQLEKVRAILNRAGVGSNAQQAQQEQQPQQVDEKSAGETPVESITSMVQNTVERDLDDLYMLVMSRTSQMNAICEKILKFDLLKQSDLLDAKTLGSFVQDSQQLIMEEHNRLKRIWQRTRHGLFDSIQSKLLIAEKDAELEEVQNRKTVFEEQIKHYQVQLQKSPEDNQNQTQNHATNTSTLSKVNESQSTSQKQFSRRSSNLDERSANSQEDYLSDDNIDDDDDDDFDQNSQDEEDDENDTAQIKQNSPAVTKKKIAQTPQNSSKLSTQQSAEQQSSSSSIKKKYQADKSKSQLSSFGAAANQKQKKKRETTNPFNRISVSLIESIMSASRSSKAPDSDKPFLLDKRFTELSHFQIQKKISSTTPNPTSGATATTSSNQISQWLRQATLTITPSTSSQSQTTPATIITTAGTTTVSSTTQISNAIQLQPQSNSIGTTAISASADSAAQFFNKAIIRLGKIKPKLNADGTSKRAIMKQQNVIRHIANIYQDRMRLLKNESESQAIAKATLNLATYEYFLNQFGFKKLAETKLAQFLESAMYYSVTLKVRTFTKLYGINRIMNYDFEDFDVFIRIMLQLEETTTAAQLTAGIYPFQRTTEILFRNYENKIPNAELLRLKGELEALKIQDSTQKIKNKFAIDSDSALEVLLQALIEEKKVCIQNIQSVFLAVGNGLSNNSNSESTASNIIAQLDSSGQVISFEEFSLLYRHFEPDSFNAVTQVALYYNNCDLFDRYTSQKTMSFAKFSLMSLTYGLFLKPSQDSFANKTSGSDRIANIDTLAKFWEDKKDVIRLRFVKNSAYRLQFRQMIRKIDEYFASDKSRRTVLDRNSAWFTYRLLDEESKRVMLEAHLKHFVDDSLLALSQASNQIFLKVAMHAKATISSI